MNIIELYKDYRAMGLTHRNAIKNCRDDVKICLPARRKCEALLTLRHLNPI